MQQVIPCGMFAVPKGEHVHVERSVRKLMCDVSVRARGAHSPRCQLRGVTCSDIPGLCVDCHGARLQLLWIPVTSNKLIAFQRQEIMENNTHSWMLAHKHHYLVIWMTRHQITRRGVFLSALTLSVTSLKTAWQRNYFHLLKKNLDSVQREYDYSIKPFLSRLNRVLLHTGHRDAS